MTVYVVTTGEYSDFRLVGLFSTRKLAEAFVRDNSNPESLEKPDVAIEDDDQLGCPCVAMGDYAISEAGLDARAGQKTEYVRHYRSEIDAETGDAPQDVLLDGPFEGSVSVHCACGEGVRCPEPKNVCKCGAVYSRSGQLLVGSNRSGHEHAWFATLREPGWRGEWKVARYSARDLHGKFVERQRAQGTSAVSMEHARKLAAEGRQAWLRSTKTEFYLYGKPEMEP